MGANQSSNTDTNSGAGGGVGAGLSEERTCYYRLLGIECSASDEE